MSPPIPPGRRENRPAAGAFTLAELIVVMVILAIIAAMVVPQAIGTSDVKVQAAARVLLADLEYAQNCAIVTQTAIDVTFDRNENSYKLSVSNESDPLEHPITKKAYQVDFDTQSEFEGVSIAAVSFGGSPKLTFTALGAPQANGSVDVAAGDFTYRLTVAPVTGRVTVAKVP